MMTTNQNELKKTFHTTSSCESTRTKFPAPYWHQMSRDCLLSSVNKARQKTPSVGFAPTPTTGCASEPFVPSLFWFLSSAVPPPPPAMLFSFRRRTSSSHAITASFHSSSVAVTAAASSPSTCATTWSDES